MKFALREGLVFLCVVIAIALIGCGGGGGGGGGTGNPTGATTSLPADDASFATAVGTGKNEVALNKTAIGLNTFSLQVRLTNVPPGFAPTVTVKTVSGKTKELGAAMIPFGGVVLAANEVEFAEIEPFSALTFSLPIPAGANIEIYDADHAPAGKAGVRAAAATYQKRMDFNGDGKVDSSDIIFYIAWYQITEKTLSNVLARAREIWATIAGPVLFLPTMPTDDLNGDGKADSQDAAIFIAWYQINSSDAAAVLARAKQIYPPTTGTISVFPGEEITYSSYSLTQTVNGMNSLQLQIHIHGVPADFNTTVYLPCPIELVPWVRAANVNIPSGENPGVVLVCSTNTGATVGTFNSLSATIPLPTGATLEVVNKDTTPPTVVSVSQNPVGYPVGIVSVDGVRRWADGTCAKTAKEYLAGIDPKYTYSGDVGDGYYLIQTVDGPVKIWCDMSTDGGG